VIGVVIDVDERGKESVQTTTTRLGYPDRLRSRSREVVESHHVRKTPAIRSCHVHVFEASGCRTFTQPNARSGRRRRKVGR
jgi:hypothetical protein